MNQVKKETAAMIVAIIFIIVFILVGFVIYNENIKAALSSNTCKTLDEIMRQQAFNFEAIIEGELDTLNALSNAIVEDDTDNPKVRKTLEESIGNTNFEYISIVGVDGKGHSNDGIAIDISESEYFMRAMLGQTMVSDPLLSPIRNKMVITMYSPIKSNDEIIGVMVGSYESTRLNDALLPSFDNLGYTYIVDHDGTIIAKTENEHTITKNETLFDTFENAKEMTLDSVADVRNNMKNGVGNHIRAVYENGVRLYHYAPLDISDWYVFSAVPETVIARNSNMILKMTAILTGISIGLFALLIIYIILMQRKTRKLQELHIMQLEDIAYTDELTGFRNLRKFKIDAQRLLEENAEITYVLVKIDIENFKLINELLGFSEGDRILINVGKALDSTLDSESELFSKAGIDEFVLLYRYESEDDMFDLRKGFIDKFYELMGDEFVYNVVFPTGRYIIQRIEAQKADIVSIFEKANFAHSLAKKDKDTYSCNYDDSVMEKALYEKEIEVQMEIALENKEYKVFMQPKFRLTDEKIGGAETLVRWIKDDGKMIFPNDFIPLFEKNGFITRLDMYMFEETCKIIKGWIEEGKNIIPVSVNFSRKHLTNRGFVSELCVITEKHNIPKRFLEIELTETVMFESEEVLHGVLEEIHEAGFTLSMDDFGTGYSSLGLLKNLPVDVIKMDRGFFAGEDNKARAEIVIKKVMEMARELKIHTVAEGVEDIEHIEMLKLLGCDMVQGYYYAKPMPAEKIELN